MSGERAPVRAVWIVAPVAVVMVLFIVLLATREGGERGFNGADLTGQLAPPIVGVTIDGEPFDLDDYRGQFVVVNFFQTTCVPCRQEHPELVSFQDAYGPEGDSTAIRATLVSIAFDDTERNIRAFFEEFGGEWPIITADVGPIAVAYSVPLVPESVVVAPDGTVITKLINGIRRADLERVIAGWLEENA